MTAPPDDLVASVVVNAMAARIATLTAENKALRSALRKVALTSVMGRGPTCDGAWGAMINCHLCRKGWYADQPERHAPGCLAAGAANER